MNAKIVNWVTFQDLEFDDSPLNGTRVDSASSLAELFRSLAGRKPFLFELRGDNEATLTVGFAGEYGCVQHGSSDGSPPYQLAVTANVTHSFEFIEFLAGGTLTPIPGRFCLPVKEVSNIVAHFLTTCRLSGAVRWEEI